MLTVAQDSQTFSNFHWALLDELARPGPLISFRKKIVKSSSSPSYTKAGTSINMQKTPICPEKQSPSGWELILQDLTQD